jgi:antirestriction protein ArdC
VRSLQHQRPIATSYIGNWLKVLKNDKRAIFTASAAARKAAVFLIGEQEQEEEQAAA